MGGFIIVSWVSPGIQLHVIRVWVIIVVLGVNQPNAKKMIFDNKEEYEERNIGTRIIEMQYQRNQGIIHAESLV
jgi:hypothetical protein